MIKKYRVWDKKDSRWVSPNVSIDYSGLLLWYSGYETTLIDDPERYDVQYFTGLKDKARKEIYEGDIIGFKTIQNVSWNCVIVYNSNDAAAFVYYEQKPWGKYSVILRKELTDTIEIIGNIHENPKLLEKK